MARTAEGWRSEVDRPAGEPLAVINPLVREAVHPEATRHLVVADGPVVNGSAWEIAAWLTGRSGGEGLTVTPPGPLPPVPPLG